MDQFLKRVKANDMISSLILGGIGLVLLIWPGTSTQVVCMVLGGVLLAYGIIQIVLYLSMVSCLISSRDIRAMS